MRRTLWLVSGGVLVLALLSATPADATTCVGLPPAEGRAYADSVFEGTVVDQRLILLRDRLFLVPTVQYETAVSRVWKGPASSRMFFTRDARFAGGIRVGSTVLVYEKPRAQVQDYPRCETTTYISLPSDYGRRHVEALGAPIATFAASAPTMFPATMPWSRRIEAMLMLGFGQFVSPASLTDSHALWRNGLFLIAVGVQILAALVFLQRRTVRSWIRLLMTSGASVAVLLSAGHALLANPPYDVLTRFW